MAKNQKHKTWSATAHARFARDARVATTKFLRSAPIARQWHTARLIRAYQIHLEAHRSEQAATVLLYGVMGFEPPYHRDFNVMADRVVTNEAERIASADLYVISPEMCDVVVAAAESLTIDDLQLVTADDLPTPSGCLVLPHPLVVRTCGGDLADERAFVWGIGDAVAPGLLGRHHRTAGVRITNYHDTHGPLQPQTFVELTQAARLAGTPMPPLALSGQKFLAFEYAQPDPDSFARLARASQKVDGAARHAAEAAGMSEDCEGQYVPGSELDDPHDTFMARFLYAFWRLCGQQLAEIEHLPVHHAAQVAADRSDTSPDVRLVQLRARTQTRPREGHPVEWKHRWVVTMHKVRQWYPSENRHKILLRGPYVKGPPDKPLLGGEVVRAVVR